jgi:hypothetical protein
MIETKQLVYKMLTENTGKHFLDSGGTDGRMWQRNQTKTLKDFEDEDEERYEFDWRYGEIMRTVSVFHFLTNNLEIDDICEEFNRLQDENDNWDAVCNLYGVSTEAYEMLDELHDIEIERSWNTYNGDSDLSQILQGADLTINDEQYVLIQVHGGADARGGYTDAKLFKRGDHCDYMIHEHLRDYKDSYDIEEDLREGYIETFVDYMDEEKHYTLEEVKIRIEQLNK